MAPKPRLTPADFQEAALRLNCEVAAIRAVAEKESAGTGFVKGQLLTVRFEGHIFREKTAHQFDQYPGLSHPYMRNCPYNLGTVGDWRRLEQARKLAGDVAFECASYGMFQIMGFHYELLGYTSAYAMVVDFDRSEAAQLAAFVRFLNKKKLAVLLRELRFEAFALRYNGTDAAANHYGPDIRKLYEHYRADH